MQDYIQEQYMKCIPIFSGLLALSEGSPVSDFEDSDELSDFPETICHTEEKITNTISHDTGQFHLIIELSMPCKRSHWRKLNHLKYLKLQLLLEDK